MIQATQPEQLQNNNQQETVSKVHGFSTPVANSNTITNNTNSTPPIQEVTQKKLTPKWQNHFFHWWHKIALLLLILHGLIGLWESIKFIIIEYPELNHLLELHQVEVTDINHLLSRVIITLITTSINILFAIRLAKVKETTAHNIDLIIATFLIISTKLIQSLLVQLDLVNYALQLIDL